LNKDITLQINISPGDINYAHLTVPEIVSKHQCIEHRLLIVDCCRPQKTKLVDPDIKFPNDLFERKVQKIIEIAKSLLEKGIVTSVYYLKPNDPLIKLLSKKYLRNLYDCTHSAGGTANMSYWAGIELSNTQYVLHYDGDILIYQAENYKWVDEAKILMDQNQNVIIAIPRLCPPVEDNTFTQPSLHEGRPLIDCETYWLNDWFSTRHFLIDKAKLEKYLPLPVGKVAIELLLRKYGNKAFPIDPEILMFKSIGTRGGKRLVLKNKQAWITHPTVKNESFIKNLPAIIKLINENKYPKEQIGYEDLNLPAWLNYIESTVSD
jgi:hypothetical protein